MKKIWFYISIAIIGILLLYYILGYLLAVNKPINSPYILLEGWMSHIVMEEASQYIKDENVDSIFIIGMKYSEVVTEINDVHKTRIINPKNNLIVLNSNGFIAISLPNHVFSDTSKIQFNLRGSKDVKYMPHYEFFMNGNIIGHGFANDTPNNFTFKLSKNTKDSTSYFLINFDNDRNTKHGDRNLYISDVFVDSVKIGELTNDIFFVASSESPNIPYVLRQNTVQYYMHDCKIDSSKIRIIEIDYTYLNKSIAFAKGAQKYIHNSNLTSFNLVTADIHSARSYFNFKNSLGNRIKLGCIPVKRNSYKQNSIKQGIDERISLVYTWFYWLFN